MAVFLLILKIIGITLLSVIVLIILVLSLPAFAYIKFDDELTADVRFLFFKFRVYPSEGGNESGAGQRFLQRIWRFLTSTSSGKKSDEQTPLEAPDEVGFKALFDERGAAGAINFLWQIFLLVSGRFVKVLRGVAVSKFVFKLETVGEDSADAALRYGKLCGIVYPLLSLIFQNVRSYKHEIDMRPNYDKNLEYDQFSLNVTLRIYPIIVLVHVIALILNLIVSETKRQVAENLEAAEIKSN